MILFIFSRFSMLHMCSSSLLTRPGRTCGCWSAPLTSGKHISHGSSSPVSHTEMSILSMLLCVMDWKQLVKSVWPWVMEWKCGLGEKGQVWPVLSDSLAFVFATHIYWVVLFVTKGHPYCRWQHNPGNNNYSPWLAFGGLAVSASIMKCNIQLFC